MIGLQVHEARRVALLGDGEDAPLAFVGELPDVARAAHIRAGRWCSLPRSACAPALFMNDLRVVGQVGCRGDDLVQQVDELVAPDRVEAPWAVSSS